MTLNPSQLLAMSESFRSVFKRAGKIGAPASGAVGVMGDLGSPVANFTLILTCFAAITAVIGAIMWFGLHRRKLALAMADGKITTEEMKELVSHNKWSIMFAFGLVTTLLLGTVLLLQKANDADDGLLAKFIPAVEQMQKDLGLIKKDVAKISEDTTKIASNTDKISADTGEIKKSLQDISASFASLSAKGGMIENPKSPEQWYQNARYSEEVKGDRGGARKAYAEFFREKLEFVDPWQRFTAILKAEEGLAGARESLAVIGAGNETMSYQLARALLQEPTARTKVITELAKAHPEFGPALYQASREWSSERLGSQSLADKKEELGWLQKVQDSNQAGQFYKYFLDKKIADQSLSDVEIRLTQLKSQAAALETPVRLMHQQSNLGWMIILTLADYDAKEIFTKLDEAADFKSTGTQAMINPRTGLPMPGMTLTFANLSAGDHVLHVQYKDTKDVMNGPYHIPFNTDDAILASTKPILVMTAPSWVAIQNGFIYFSQVLSFRQALKEIRYSINDDSLDKTFPFKPHEGTSTPDLSDDKYPIYIKAPAGTKFVSIQLTYKDNEKSDVVKIEAK